MLELKYGLNDRPPPGETFLLGMQWFAIAVPVIIIIGKIAGELTSSDPAGQAVYLQKMAFVMAVFLFLQIFLGHRLPLIIGPSTILLIGMIASRDVDSRTVNTAILSGGLLLAFLSVTGLFALLKRLFTSRVVSCVLLLIAFTLLPSTMNLVLKPQGGLSPGANLAFAGLLLSGTFVFHRCLRGLWKSTLIIWAMIAGSALYRVISSESAELGPPPALFSGFFTQLTTEFSFDAGVLISFLVCFVALSINDLGSIQSVNEILKPGDEQRRVSRGVLFTGLANMASGFLGVIGPVNFSLSPGVISSTGCASRYCLVPTCACLLVLSFSPAAIRVAGMVPSAVVGSVFVYILCAQVAAGLSVAFEAPGRFEFADGLIIAAPILLGTLVAFLPPEVFRAFPSTLRPIVGNGFVVGVLAALVLEHGVFSRR